MAEKASSGIACTRPFFFFFFFFFFKILVCVLFLPPSFLRGKIFFFFFFFFFFFCCKIWRCVPDHPTYFMRGQLVFFLIFNFYFWQEHPVKLVFITTVMLNHFLRTGLFWGARERLVLWCSVVFFKCGAHVIVLSINVFLISLF